MSKTLGNELPAELIEDLSGRDLASKWSQTIPLVTIDGSGFPHFAILSYGEILATSPAADLTVERIGDLVGHDLSTLRARAGAGAAAGPARGR